ncbi:hypothetical protein FFLO_00224 [Filobasidium floriforme]|uniref:COP9 signalosome complex subunit 6 n=1 Tax=Filobasidium floriforme TaxID=5210 RepID=A0A8K0NR64_9TREE|nr:putative COP9 complex subunit 6 [Filobasidium floriforme]KAG7580016.1 hypothetical protein FFLO_00224 [Filobasidium floriforme]KAH8087416.1 putative COP9 complex subunit 6 [Filobasidium floriforme]
MTSSKPNTSNTGLSISLHPLPILNISEHYMRNSLRRGSEKTYGALLGTQSGREVSVINTFELKLAVADVDMDANTGDGENATASGNGSASTGGSGAGSASASGSGGSLMDMEFLEKRRGQYKEVFPTLDIVGWYSIGEEPTGDDLGLHKQFLPILETPLFLLMTPPSASSSTKSTFNSSDLPLRIYESALAQPQDANNTKAAPFLELGYTVETGEAERIAVDGAVKAVAGGGEGSGEQDGVGDEGLVAHLNTQRNAIKMLHDRMVVLLNYISGVIRDSTMKMDHQVVREISALVSGLPVMSDQDFQLEFLTEYTDTQLMGYLASLTKQVAGLNDLTDKFALIYGRTEDKPGAGPAMMGMNIGMGGGSGAGKKGGQRTRRGGR